MRLDKNKYDFYLDNPVKIEPATANEKPMPKMTKFLKPLISLYRIIPHKAAIADGP